MKRNLYCLSLLVIAVFVVSCASTGPKVSREEKKRKEEEFNAKFLLATQNWLPRIYRIGYQLVSASVPGHGNPQPKFGFAGIGVDELKDYARVFYKVDKSVKGVLVLGTYPGSKAEFVDLRAGDVIVKLDGRKTKSLGGYFKAVRKARQSPVTAEVWRDGGIIPVEIPIEKVYYNAQFFLAPTPDVDAHAAFSKIAVGIGAIRYCRNDDELAVIMGHELAHTTLKHSLKKIGVTTATGIVYGVLAGALDVVTFSGVGSALIWPVQSATDAAISRRYEREADYYGMLHTFFAGYDVESGSKIFGKLATDAPSHGLMAYTFSTHPKSSERFLRLEKIVEELKLKYPERNWQKSPDWEITIPVTPGETLDEAVNRLLEEKRLEEEAKAEREKDATQQAA